MDLQLVERRCKKCPRSFKVMKKSEQVFCSKLCKEIDEINIDGRYHWTQGAAPLRPPKAGFKKAD